MARVRFENVNKFFGETPAVRDLSFEIREGEFFSILGPSGCGKTTTLRMLAGFEQPDSGRIFFDAEEVTSLPPEQRNTGMVFQSYALFPHLSVFENVAFGLRARKRPQPEINERVAAALALVDMGELQKRLVTQLSGGQQQRVALARALAVQPKILLLDEPLSNLDAQLRRSTRSELKNLQRRLGITTIYVTHDQEEALALSDRMLVLQKGVMQQIGTPEEIYHRPANIFVMSFIGASNTLTGKIVNLANGQTTVAGENWQLLLPSKFPYLLGAAVYLAFRPEHGRIHFTGAPAPDSAGTIVAEIKTIEFGGSHWLVQCEVGGETCFVRVPAEEIKNAALHGGANGRRVHLSLLPQHIHLFAAE